MSDCKPVAIPMQPKLFLPKLESTPPEDKHLPFRKAVGQLLYLAISCRPDILYAVNYLSRFVTGYSKQHWAAVQHVLRYLKATQHLGITIQRFADNPLTLYAYCDSDWGGNADRKSISGFFFIFCGSIVSWMTKAQSTIALSSTEAEYIACTETGRQLIHLRRLLHELGCPQQGPTTIFTDNQSAKALSTNSNFHARTKHFDIRHHWIRELVSSQQATLEWCPTEDMIADMLTKALPRVKHQHLCQLIGLLPIHPSSNSD